MMRHLLNSVCYQVLTRVRVTKQFGFRFLFASSPKPFVFSSLASLAVELQDWLAEFESGLMIRDLSSGVNTCSRVCRCMQSLC